jgi:hypothetical protein
MSRVNSSTPQLPELFQSGAGYMMGIVMLIPFMYGFVNLGIRGGTYGASISGLGFALLWTYSCYKQAMLCHNDTHALLVTSIEARSKDKIAHKSHIDRREALIDLLKRRSENLSDQCNGKAPRHKSITSEDVLKVTGEIKHHGN